MNAAAPPPRQKFRRELIRRRRRGPKKSARRRRRPKYIRLRALSLVKNEMPQRIIPRSEESSYSYTVEDLSAPWKKKSCDFALFKKRRSITFSHSQWPEKIERRIIWPRILGRKIIRFLGKKLEKRNDNPAENTPIST
jgi:hypothetical protein